jgi:hypothetical protein
MATKKTKAAPAVEAPVETKAELEPVQLTITDLQLLSRVVDLASRRGAFQGPELTHVGGVFDKLSGFLAYVEQEQAKTSTPAAEATVA